MEKSEFYRQMYRAVASYNLERGLDVKSEGWCPFRVPFPIRKKCLLTAAETAKTLPEAKVVSYYDFEENIVVTRARKDRATVKNS